MYFHMSARRGERRIYVVHLSRVLICATSFPHIMFKTVSLSPRSTGSWLWYFGQVKKNLLGQGAQFSKEENGNPLKCSCLENPRDRGAWWAAVYGVAQSRTRLKRLSSCTSFQISKKEVRIPAHPPHGTFFPEGKDSKAMCKALVLDVHRLRWQFPFPFSMFPFSWQYKGCGEKLSTHPERYE